MKLKEKLAEEYNLENSGDAEVNFYLAGFEKARELLAERFKTHADWAFEGFNQGEATIHECAYTEQLLRFAAKKIERLGEEEV